MNTFCNGLMWNTNTTTIQKPFLANNGYDPQLRAGAGQCIVGVSEFFKQWCVAFHSCVQSRCLHVLALTLSAFR